MPKRPSSGHRSAGPKPCPVMAAYAAAATALSASCSGEPGSGSAGSVPPMALSWRIAKQRMSSARQAHAFTS